MKVSKVLSFRFPFLRSSLSRLRFRRHSFVFDQSTPFSGESNLKHLRRIESISQRIKQQAIDELLTAQTVQSRRYLTSSIAWPQNN
ncbi:unnamed protein product [Brassica rapa subsp. narinosa]